MSDAGFALSEAQVALGQARMEVAGLKGEVERLRVERDQALSENARLRETAGAELALHVRTEADLAAAVALLREAADCVLGDRMAAYQTHDMARLPRDLTERIRAFIAGQPAPAATVVHLLVNGLAACGAGAPATWPEGERWTGRALVTTCPTCRTWAKEHDYHREKG